MMQRAERFLILQLFLLTSFFAYASPVDTVHVITHQQQTIVTEPSKGFHVYKSWGVFPKEKVPIRKIILHVTFACPDGMRCADWDYNDHITLRRKGGVNGASQDYELARMLTPYGGAFAKDWRFNWDVDVTDFSLLLRDSVEIEYNHTGYEPNQDRGWSVTLDFEIIKGQPAWQPISIQKIYDGFYRYGDSTNNIENQLKLVSFEADKQADFARLRVVQTGHGMDEPDGCGEFCSKYREIWYDGKLIDTRNIWKPCGNNPLYPQAGTWVYDRANWCPGTLMQPDIYDLNVKGLQQHTVDINMQPYISPKPSADENITAYLIQYKKAAAANDVAIEDVINPSMKDVYRRQNPSAMQPQIIIKNMGGAIINRMTIRYGTPGFDKKIFQWKGRLAPAATATITLPGTIDSKEGLNNFVVEVIKLDGKKDSYMADNKMTSRFQSVATHDSTLVVYLMTNNQPSQNSYVLRSSDGNIIKERAFGTLKADTVYRDTLVLPKGYYQFMMLDSAGNGLEFWANRSGGRGVVRLLNAQGQMIKDFESDFGSSLHYEFAVGQPITPVSDQSSFGLFPTRTSDKTTFDYFANTPQEVVVQIMTDPGDTIVEEHIYHQLKEGMFTYDLSRFPKGRFYLKVLVNGKEQFKKRIRLKE